MKMVNGIEITKEDEDRFWAKVNIDLDNRCWYWMAGKGAYGRLGRIRMGKGRITFNAPRVAFAIANGGIKEGQCVLHSRICTENALVAFGDGRLAERCCNPKHLRLGTRKENSQDMVATGMAKGQFTGNRDQSGEKNNMCKLTLLQVQAIKKDSRIAKIIAKEYGVGQSQISRIKTGARRKDG